MNFSYWLLIPIVLSVVVIGYIVFRKFPTLASIDTTDMPDEQQNKLKKEIMAERLSRKIEERLGFVRNAAVPAWRVVVRVTKEFYNNIRILENQYRLKRSERPKSATPTRIVERDILVEANRAFAEGDLQKAEEAYISLIRHDETNVEAYEGLSEVYFAKKEYEHAKETLNFVVQLKEQDTTEKAPEKKNGKGKKKASEDERELALHHFELGEIYEKNGERDKALRSFKEAVRLDNRNPKYLDRLIETSIMQGNKLLSQKTLDTLKEVNADNTKIRDWQRRIDTL